MRVLIISPIEIFLEPRLRKAAASFCNAGYEVHVLVCLKMHAHKNQFEDIKSTYSSIIWHETDIRKNSFFSRVNWLISKILNRIYVNTYKLLKLDISGSLGILNDAFITSKKINLHFDIIYTNLIDNLPLAHNYSKRSKNCKLIYDSQEYFTGQYSKMNRTLYDWVCKTESKFIDRCDLVISTTNVMKDALLNKYPQINKIVRVRNLPLKEELPEEYKYDINTPVKIIWHGKSINIESERGLHLIIRAVLNIDVRVDLFLQGSITNLEIQKLQNLIQQTNSENRIQIVPSAKASEILESIVNYDIGFIGEIATEENQVLTSSNKLFDYITSGLAVLSPSILGILETTEEFNNAAMYDQGSLESLIDQLRKMLIDKEYLLTLKANSRNASMSCLWEFDFQYVLQSLTNDIEQIKNKENLS
jgi:glycosyltransferase involved in cell wall biosynthesis